MFLILIGRILLQSLLLLREHTVFSVCSCAFACMLSQHIFFPQLLHSVSSAGLLCDGCRFGALQTLQGLSFVILLFRLIPIFPFCLIISIVFFRSSFFYLISVSRNLVFVIAILIFETSRTLTVTASHKHSFSFFISLC